MIKKNSFKYEELIDCANGKLFGPGNAKLPSPPMLMFHRITNVQENNGKFNKGLIEAEFDIKEKSDIEKITQQFLLTEDEIKKRDKNIRKQAKIEEKRKMKGGKKIKKQMRLEKKKKKEKEKLVRKQNVLIEKSSNEVIKNDYYLSAFDKIRAVVVFPTPLGPEKI